MVQVTKTTQLSTFTIIKNIIKSNSTLSKKFTDNNIYQFDPFNLQSKDLILPFIYVAIPGMNNNDKTLGNNNTYDKGFQLPIKIAIEYVAKDNFINYLNALVYEFEKSSNKTILSASGYDDVEIDVDEPLPEIFHNNQVISCTIILKFSGEVISG